MKNYISKIVNAAALSLLLAGCVTMGNKIDPAVVASFQPGVTTITEVKAKLGEPTQMTQESNGSTILLYSFASSKQSASSFIPGVGAFVGSNSTESQMTELSFDKSGKFTQSSVTSGNTTSGSK
jgi:outer membrane protein assembly factor BamE (lipoprotein component of BamABCDE complex)